MASWTLVPCLQCLFDEINTLAPGRDRASDGALGDTRHAAGGSSDHLPDEQFSALRDKDPDSANEVHAIDVDKDLNQPGWSMERIVQTVVLRHRNGLDDRLQNVIFNRRIWSRSWGWTAREYTGPNPHDKHAHFSARYTAAQERDTRPWGLLTPSPVKSTVEEFVMATKDDVKQALREVLDEPRPYLTAASGPGQRLQKAGWNPTISPRALWEYVLERVFSQQDATAAQVEAVRAQIVGLLQAIDADPGNPVQLDAEQAQALADQLAARLPAVIATAVGDETARRMQS